MTLFLVGGGPHQGLAEVHDEFAAAVGKRGGRVAVFLVGSGQDAEGQLADYVDPIRERLPDVRIEPVRLLPTGTEWPEDFEALAGLVVADGPTADYLDRLAPQRDRLAHLVRRGVPYLGYGAGAMIASKHAIVGGWKRGPRQVAPEQSGEGREQVEVRDGLALVGTTIQTRADTGFTLGRALAALESGRATSCAALDDRTALAVDAASGRTRVLGDSLVHWLIKEGANVVVRPESGRAPGVPEPETATRSGRL